MENKKNIALVMGGYSGEHDISIASGHQVYAQLDKEKYEVYPIVVCHDRWYWESPDGEQPVDRADFTVCDRGRTIHFDLAYILIHGNPGENGVLQGYFDMLGIRYTGCGFYTSALTFHKGYCNRVVKSLGVVEVSPSVVVGRGVVDAVAVVAEAGLRYPVFVKPAAGGSSVATTKVKSPEALAAAIAAALDEDNEAMVEQSIVGREFDCGVMTDATGKVVALPLTEIIPTGGHEFFDYEAKYKGFSNEVTPAEVDAEIAEQIQHVSRQLYTLLGCKGIVRFDYIYDTTQRTLYFLEVNTIPGQSSESIVPKEARAMGMTPAELYELAIQTALHEA